MKKYLILILLLMLAGCSSTQSGVNKEYDMMLKVDGQSTVTLNIYLDADTAATTEAGDQPATITIDPATEINLPASVKLPSIPKIAPKNLPITPKNPVSDTMSLDEYDLIVDTTCGYGTAGMTVDGRKQGKCIFKGKVGADYPGALLVIWSSGDKLYVKDSTKMELGAGDAKYQPTGGTDGEFIEVYPPLNTKPKTVGLYKKQ